jgi:anthranilate phosphoribosyltransferase
MIREAIQSLVEGQSLTIDEAVHVMEEIMDGQVTPSQFGAFVTALRIKGESVEEIAGLARTMRARSIPVRSPGPLVDTCGTGGDGVSTFNVSTTAAFIVAGAGLSVAKHGNRAMSSKSGSADVLEALGIRIELTAEQVEQSLREVGIGFMFAPAFHPSMKYASAPRREIGIRTVFNILGPLSNPAGAQAQLIGVATEQLGSKMARALSLLGAKHALVVHGAGGIDELSITGRSRVWELQRDVITDYDVSPEDFGYRTTVVGVVRGGTAADNAQILRAILEGEKGPRRDMAVMNAAAAILAGTAEADTEAGGVALLAACARRAEKAIDNGAALNKLEQMIKVTRSFGTA